jgi:hypothetical protein
MAVTGIPSLARLETTAEAGGVAGLVMTTVCSSVFAAAPWESASEGSRDGRGSGDTASDVPVTEALAGSALMAVTGAGRPGAVPAASNEHSRAAARARVWRFGLDCPWFSCLSTIAPDEWITFTADDQPKGPCYRVTEASGVVTVSLSDVIAAPGAFVEDDSFVILPELPGCPSTHLRLQPMPDDRRSG